MCLEKGPMIPIPSDFMSSSSSPALRAFRRQIERAREEARSDPLRHWIQQELNNGEIPTRLSIGEWPIVLEALVDWARMHGETTDPELKTAIMSFGRAVLRFSRSDGTMLLHKDGTSRSSLVAYARSGHDPGLAQVCRWWFPRLVREPTDPVAPPLPASSSSTSVRAILRADWARQGDWIAVDQGHPDQACLVEVAGGGNPWVGGRWRVGEGRESRARPVAWTSGFPADGLEWRFGVGDIRVIRTAISIPTRRLALLGDQVEAPGAQVTASLEIPDGAVARLDDDGLRVRIARGARASAWLIPLTLGPETVRTGQGRVEVKGQVVEQVVPCSGRRGWVGWLLSWDPVRARKPMIRKRLTVSENSKIVGPDAALGIRVSFGSDETYLVYRSLGKPGLRAVLGHQTRARFLVGRFLVTGSVEPLLTWT